MNKFYPTLPSTGHEFQNLKIIKVKSLVEVNLRFVLKFDALLLMHQKEGQVIKTTKSS
jgi:hypothetical protein